MKRYEFVKLGMKNLPFDNYEQLLQLRYQMLDW